MITKLQDTEIDSVAGGDIDWEGIGYAVGKAIGEAGDWYYHNILIGNPW